MHLHIKNKIYKSDISGIYSYIYWSFEVYTINCSNLYKCSVIFDSWYGLPIYYTGGSCGSGALLMAIQLYINVLPVFINNNFQ